MNRQKLVYNFKVIQKSNQYILFPIHSTLGSPFQFTVGPITDGGAHKVRAMGPGLCSGDVSKSSSCY